MYEENFNNNQGGVSSHCVHKDCINTHKAFASKTDTIRVGTSQNKGQVYRALATCDTAT